MPRRVFFSFHFDNDYWRTQQVRQIGALEGQQLVTPNAWEEVKRKGDAAVQKWIDDNMYGKSCLVVLTGSQTASRPWVRYEITKAWNDGKGVLGIRIHRLLDRNGQSSSAGPNPFERVSLRGHPSIASVVPLKDPLGFDSKEAYASIARGIDGWIEEAIRVRNNYRAS